MAKRPAGISLTGEGRRLRQQVKRLERSEGKRADLFISFRIGCPGVRQLETRASSYQVALPSAPQHPT